MSCPKCGSDDWKMASVIHAEGKSKLSKLSAAPKPPESDTNLVAFLLYVILAIFFIVNKEGTTSLQAFLMAAPVLLFFPSDVELFESKKKQKKEKMDQYLLEQLEYQKKKICSRCWTLFED
jgi:hypothetical protein